MTIPIERNWAIRNVRLFLYSLLDPSQTPKVPKDIRVRARQLLKHYPSDFDIERVASGEKDVFEKSIEEREVNTRKRTGTTRKSKR